MATFPNIWDLDTKRFYETGVSKGMLFVKGTDGTYGEGVVWNGLTAVNEAPEGAEATPLYADNVKYLNLRSAENFKCTIEAYTYPDEFEACEGRADAAGGKIKVTGQARREFAFVYRTEIGNDSDAAVADGNQFKIHIVYGASCAPSSKDYATINDSPEAITFSWEVDTTPVAVTGFAKTAKFEIDSRDYTATADAAKLQNIIDALYGKITTSGSGSEQTTTYTPPSTIPTPDELIALATAN